MRDIFGYEIGICTRCGSNLAIEKHLITNTNLIKVFESCTYSKCDYEREYECTIVEMAKGKSIAD